MMALGAIDMCKRVRPRTKWLVLLLEILFPPYSLSFSFLALLAAVYVSVGHQCAYLQQPSSLLINCLSSVVGQEARKPSMFSLYVN